MSKTTMITCYLYSYEAQEPFDQIDLPAVPRKDERIFFFPQGGKEGLEVIVHAISYAAEEPRVRLMVGTVNTRDIPRFRALLAPTPITV